MPRGGKHRFHLVGFLSMRINEPLDDVLQSRSHVRLLRALYGLPAQVAVSGRDLARRAGLSHPTVSKILASFAQVGLVRVRRTPQAGYYELNRGHVLFEPMRHLFGWEAALPRALAILLGHELARHRVPASHAMLFGSAARGDMTSDSDIDLAVIVPAEAVDEAEAALEVVGDAVRDRYGAHLSVIIGTAPLEQLQRPGSPGHRLWEQIGSEGIRIDLATTQAAVG
jgi:DNA-binding transcriptional ArsR family regulator